MYRPPMPRKRARADPAFAELAQFEVDEDTVRLLPHRYCVENHVVLLGRLAKEPDAPVLVGLLDPREHRLLEDVAAVLRRPVEPVRLNEWEIERAIEQGFGKGKGGREGFALELKATAEVDFKRRPIERVLDEVLGHAVRMRASDVHIECYEADVDVRVRVDGVMRQLATPISQANVRQAVSRLKVLASLDIAERRRAQEGQIRATYEEDGAMRPVDFRLSVVPGPYGEDAVLRILDGGARVLSLDGIGFDEEVLRRFRRVVENPEGLVLVTGPTSSGKTSTIYAALEHVRTEQKKVVTVEDPIEYFFPKTNQKQVGPAMGFADFARAFLRQNPDVIVIGEIRDEETAAVATRAAQTGHLVMTTVHTGDAVRAISRLRALHVDEDVIAGCLLASLAQRLVRRVCPDCAEETPPTEDQIAALVLEPHDRRFFAGRGCEACGGTGHRGRTGVFELFVLDDELADMIARDEPVLAVRERAVAKGMRTLLADALDKARRGETSLAEILRVVPYRMIASERRIYQPQKEV